MFSLASILAVVSDLPLSQAGIDSAVDEAAQWKGLLSAHNSKNTSPRVILVREAARRRCLVGQPRAVRDKPTAPSLMTPAFNLDRTTEPAGEAPVD